MPKTLIVPDIHERMERLGEALRDRLPEADRVVFLGDWFDAFGLVALDRVRAACLFINANIDGLELGDAREGTQKIVPATFLFGNHDCHYFFSNRGFRCSGYNWDKQAVIDEAIDPLAVRKFRIFTRVGPYLVSHAGFHEATLQYARPEVEEQAIKDALNGGFDPLFGAGVARGGALRIGGPTWLDWNAEFEHIEGVPQIVGHTNGSAVRTKGEGSQHKSWCLDAALHYVAWVDEETGKVTCEKVTA